MEAATALQPIAKRGAEDQALDAIRSHVLGGGASPGTRLTEHGLSGALAISRATVRVALHRLAAEGLIIQRPYTGWEVVSLSPRDVWELYTLRAPLEALAARLAAETMDDEGQAALRRAFEDLSKACAGKKPTHIAEADFSLHQLVVDYAGHARLREQYRVVGQQVRLFVAETNALAASPAEIAVQHRPIVDALLARDGAGAAQLAEKHVLTEGRKLEAVARAKEEPPDQP